MPFVVETELGLAIQKIKITKRSGNGVLKCQAAALASLDPADVEKARRMMAQSTGEEKITEPQVEDSKSLSESSSLRDSKRLLDSKNTSSPTKSPASPPPNVTRKTKGQAPPVPAATPSVQPVVAPRQRELVRDSAPIPAPRSMRKKKHSIESLDPPSSETVEGKAAEKEESVEVREAAGKMESGKLVHKAEEERERDEDEEEREEEEDERDEDEEEDSRSKDSKDGIEKEKGIFWTR